MSFQLDRSCDKWRQPLRNIAVARPVHNPIDNVTTYRLIMNCVRHTFHPKLKNIPIFTYGKSSPGALIVAAPGKPIRVEWFSALAGTNLNDIIEFGDRQGMEEDHMLAVPHNVPHLHGARVPWTSDGFPEHVIHPNESHLYYYPNQQSAGTLWYHDHAMMVTRLNVYAGLFGGYVLRDPKEDTTLPAGVLELALVLQDKSFSNDGKKLRYAQVLDDGAGNATPEFIGDYPVVNGQIWPITRLRPRIYRIRLWNGANTRFFNLSFSRESDPGDKLTFAVIGMEGGFLPTPAQHLTELLLAPGERADVLLDLRELKGADIILRNNASIPYSNDDATIDPNDACDELLRMQVRGTKSIDDERFDPVTIALPVRADPLQPAPPLRSSFAAIEAAVRAVPFSELVRKNISVSGLTFTLRRFKLQEYQLEMPTAPGIRVPTVLINEKSWEADSADPSIVTVKKDSYEVWEFQNVTPDTHPMHIHLVQFQVMSRVSLNTKPGVPHLPELPEPVDITDYAGPGVRPPEFEQGWKDTVRCNPNESTLLLMRFDGFAGVYVYHCHILEHEDMGMMFRVRVEP